MKTPPPDRLIEIPTLQAPPLPEPPEEGQDRFCPISLADWLSVCQRANVPHVGAEKIADIRRSDYIRSEEQGEHQKRLAEALNTVSDRARENFMVRLDYCASMDIKYFMSTGKCEWTPAFGRIFLNDPRTLDILMEYPRPVVPVWQRPWITPNIIDGYPEEYRAFVFKRKLAGVSSYYPQRPLLTIRQSLMRVASMTQRLIEVIETPMLSHLRPALQSESGADYTCAFMVTKQGDVLFLEGGPSHLAGAHPCCFKFGEDIEGVALTDQNRRP